MLCPFSDARGLLARNFCDVACVLLVRKSTPIVDVVEQLQDSVDLPFGESISHKSLLRSIVWDGGDSNLLAKSAGEGIGDIIQTERRRHELVGGAAMLLGRCKDIGGRLAEICDNNGSVLLGWIARVV